ncbi:hypothetical protein [Dokdonella sp.]|uniref:hypothetical protein n=1 Tax=Dokdonella sp. TaxID=2291710 RepID=UPI003526E4D3
MSLSLASLLVIVVAIVIGSFRSGRAPGMRRWLFSLGQLLLGAALALLLFPPPITRSGETAFVATSGTTESQWTSIAPEATRLVLPEAASDPHTGERVVDLASALREHPEIESLHVLGDGLPERDRAAVADRGLVFEAADEPRGVVDLKVPEAVGAGTVWSVSGRVSGVADARVELLDRSGAVVASAPLDAEGRFELSTVARSNTRMRYGLRVLDAEDAVVEEAPIAVAAGKADALRIEVIAGAPDAELKYLRRWIVDAGHVLGSQIALSRGIEQRQSAASLDPGSLAETDLLILDERAWTGLPQSARESIRAAVEAGMGLLLRVTGPVPSKVAEDWAALGFQLDDADVSRSVEVGNLPGEPGESRTLSRRPLVVRAADSVPLLVASDGSDLARWRALGQGRVGLWLPLDTWRMTLEGDRHTYETLWSDTFSTLARARGKATPQWPRQVRVDQRSVICGLQTGAEIENADGVSRALLVETDDASSSAAWWPDRAGWHELINGEERWPIHVLDRGEADSLQRMATREATLALVNETPVERRTLIDMPRWPFFLLWLALAGMVWWLERRRPISQP